MLLLDTTSIRTGTYKHHTTTASFEFWDQLSLSTYNIPFWANISLRKRSTALLLVLAVLLHPILEFGSSPPIVLTAFLGLWYEHDHLNWKMTHINKGFKGFGIHEGAICRVKKNSPVPTYIYFRVFKNIFKQQDLLSKPGCRVRYTEVICAVFWS